MLQNITLSLDKDLIVTAREQAQREHTTLNALVRELVAQYVRRKSKAEGEERVRKYRELMKRLKYVKIGRKFTREEMNARR
jgi:hypothetical protein